MSRRVVATPDLVPLSTRSPQARLEVELQGHLTDPWIPGAGHNSESAVANVPRGRLKHRVVPHVEKLGSELQLEPLRDIRHLVDGQIPVVESRAVEEPPVGVSC